MKPAYKLPVIVSILLVTTFFFSFGDKNTVERKSEFPYKTSGLTERQAAAHLLSRFSFGAKPGDIDMVVKMGLEKWFMQQLNGSLADDDVNLRLKNYDALSLTNAEVLAKYPRPVDILKMAVKDGFIKKDTMDVADKEAYRKMLEPYVLQKGLQPQRELFRQFQAQKIVRALYSNNQMHEMLTDFWFNHFNVSITKRDCAEFIPAYERDVIRPNVTGKFSQLLLATSKSPAMLLYLDNFSSSAANNEVAKENSALNKKFAERIQAQLGDSSGRFIEKIKKARKGQGLNENYAREVMELHTLGVDGGYTQQDVTQAAKVLTGWTLYPFTEYGIGSAMKKIIDKIGEDKLVERGYVHEGDFMFAINRHDNSEKIVLGKKFAANGGYDEGVDLLKMLAHHPSTAKFISRKLAVRFVNDNPSSILIDKMAKTFTEKNGDIKQLLITLASSPEFWSQDALREKTKSPFELAISSVRSLDATVKQPFQLNNWITKMGQKMYFYQAPTGFPDRGQYWINTGSLLNRMNFGLALAAQKIPGITFNLSALNNNREPESAESALIIYGKLLMPERNLDETIKRLTPLLNDPNLVKKVNDAAGKTAPPVETTAMQGDEMMGGDNGKDKIPKERLRKKNTAKNTSIMNMQTYAGNTSMLSQVVGIIIGSPEYQRK